MLCCSCQSVNCQIEPNFSYIPTSCDIENRSSAFSSLSKEEYRYDWAKELIIANQFAIELDLYRAITSYKRARILLPTAKKYAERRLQIDYGLVQAYYLGQKYQETIDIFEKGPLFDAPNTFPAMDDLLVIVYDSYQKLNKFEKACKILSFIESRSQEAAANLRLSEALINADWPLLSEFSEQENEDSLLINNFTDFYWSNAKSVKQAQVLNAILPGAGYLYVDQKQTALTSFVINTLFIAAAYHFFDHGNIAAGIITTSLEMGWYLGGINGAGLAAKEYNEALYQATGREILIKRKLFPVLMLQYAF